MRKKTMLKADPYQGAFSGMTHRDPQIADCLDRLRLLQPDAPSTVPPLQRIEKYLAKLGNPHLNMPPVIHIAGTNGKGSTLAFVQAILEAADLRVHKFTSPHLVHFNERIVLTGQDIDDDALLSVLTDVEHVIEGDTIRFFDAISIAAFLAFSRVPADVVLLETGLGGALDTTNIFDAPLVSALSTVSLDHTQVLGDTYEKIATEKCGIAKQNRPFIVGYQEKDSVYNIAKTAAPSAQCYGDNWQVSAKNDQLHYASANHDWQLPLPHMTGQYQVYNAGLAIAITEQIHNFNISKSHIVDSLKNARWRGRLQQLKSGPVFQHLSENTTLWLDGGHNASAAQMMADHIKNWDGATEVVLCLSKKRDIEDIIAPFYNTAHSVTLVPLADYERVICSLSDLQDLFRNSDRSLRFAPSWQEAVQKLAPNANRILIAGSLYLAGNVLKDHA